jgi:FkbM family methyltransferase
MKREVEELISKSFMYFGIRVTRATRLNAELNFINNFNIKTVSDVGAHTGESALKFHNLLPDARIYSFEPLRDCFIQLEDKLKNVSGFKAFNIALGNKKERREIHRSSFSASSSLRKMGDIHKQTFPYSSGDILEPVEVDTLDNILSDINVDRNVLLKVDVQGYEDNFIRGSENTLGAVKIIIIETSFSELYENQPLFGDIYRMLNERGFRYSGSLGQLDNQIDGTLLQQDSLFIK